MYTNNRILVCLGVLFVCFSRSSAFFLSWGGSDESQPKAQTHWPAAYYQPKYIQTSVPSFAVPPTDAQAQGSVPVPAIPIQVPLQAQLSPTASVQNVQLVPCLCPVSPDFEYDKEQNLYLRQK